MPKLEPQPLLFAFFPENEAMGDVQMLHSAARAEHHSWWLLLLSEVGGSTWPRRVQVAGAAKSTFLLLPPQKPTLNPKGLGRSLKRESNKVVPGFMECFYPGLTTCFSFSKLQGGAFRGKCENDTACNARFRVPQRGWGLPPAFKGKQMELPAQPP